MIVVGLTIVYFAGAVHEGERRSAGRARGSSVNASGHVDHTSIGIGYVEVGEASRAFPTGIIAHAVWVISRALFVVEMISFKAHCAEAIG